jgi:tetratricopeptide (TPR) repeat protein
LELANRALSTDLGDADLRHLLDTRGTILSKLERFAEARRDFEKLEQILPDGTRQRANALLQLGRVCAELNDLAKAEEYLNEALDIDREIDVFTPDEKSEITRILKMSDN